MYSQLFSATVYGIDAFRVEIETHLDNALPNFTIVGLPDSAVKESRERVTAAIKNSQYIFPNKKITVNLAPADIKKEGSAFDLPIAIGLLASTGVVDKDNLADCIILGELALDGTLRKIHGSLSISYEASKLGYKRIILPKANAEEAALVNTLDVIPVENLRQAVDYLNKDLKIEPTFIDLDSIFNNNLANISKDLADVKGQENVKRALEIAAAGGHNLLMIGPPGSGKTMIAQRLPGILPPLSLSESLETTKIHSVSGMLEKGEALVTNRPFRSPHHTISDAALVGGGMSKIRPGEISLAHHGVLFLDELPEFARNVLEVLRQPIEEKKIVISRTRLTVEYPANFMLVCSMNPCPCGNFGNPMKDCSCTPQQVQKYIGKISGPLLDRIDIHIEVPAVKFQDLSSKRKAEPSIDVRQRVIAARQIQIKRFAEKPTLHKNADMESKHIAEYCVLDGACEALLEVAMKRMNLSARAHDRIKKVARTIADMEGAANITVAHISEAIQYRSLDREYWK